MAKEQIIYKKALGLVPAKAQENLDWSPDGTVELAQCQNCFVDSYGKLLRATGESVIAASVGAAHTLFNKEREFIGVGTTLYERVDGALWARKANCSGNPIQIVVYGGVAYCYDGVTFFSVKADGSVGPWAFTGKKGADSSRQFSGPVAHTKSRKGFGRVMLLKSGLIFCSEPIGPVMFDYANSTIVDAYPITDFECIKGIMVVATEKGLYTRVGADFKDPVRVSLTGYPLVPNTLCSGFFNDQEVICFAVNDGIYLVTADGKADKLTENKIAAGFFEDTFIGASVVDNRYTIYSSTGSSYSVNLETKALEEHLVGYTLVEGDWGLKGTDVVQLGFGVCSGAATTVQFPLLSFDSPLNKSLRYLQVFGQFNGESTWTVADENGNSHSKTIPATGAGTKVTKIPVSSSVCGRHLQVQFTTVSEFKVESIHALPVLKVQRG